MGRIRPMAAVLRVWRPVVRGASARLFSWPLAEAARPALSDPRPRRRGLAGVARTGCAVIARAARTVVQPAVAHRWTRSGKVLG
jgi:hypothetical protein